MEIKRNTEYRIKGKSKYFKDKYGTCNPMIIIEGTDEEVFGGSWAWQKRNPACLSFAVRVAGKNIPDKKLNQVYYGHINGLAELVIKDELEEVDNG